MRKKVVKDKLVETATRLFYTQGYNRTGINQILEEAGVSKAGMYQNFRSKEEICVAYLQRMDEQLMVDLRKFIADRSDEPKPALLLFDFLQNFFETDQYRGCWCLNTVSEIPKDDITVMQEIRSQKNNFKDYVETLIDPNLPAQERTARAEMVFLLWEAALAESQVHMQSWPIGRAREMAEKMLN